MYDEIENNALNNESMSEFIINLFNEYIKAPFFERERCLYWNHIVKIKDDETCEYIFDTDLNKLYLYLLQFGRHVKIIEPKKLKNKLNNFHRLAIDEDE